MEYKALFPRAYYPAQGARVFRHETFFPKFGKKRVKRSSGADELVGTKGVVRKKVEKRSKKSRKKSRKKGHGCACVRIAAAVAEAATSANAETRV